MELTEWYPEFLTLWDNIMSNQAPSLSEYEVSIFLTEAQEAVVKGVYNGTLSNSFESTEEARSYLSNLVDQKDYDTPNSTSTIHIVSNSKLYNLPDDYYFITFESVTLSDNNDRCVRNKQVIVKPVTQDVFWDIHKNPFKQDNENRVLRLTHGNIAELVTPYNIAKYSVRYVRKPKPIILVQLGTPEELQATTYTGLTIEGEHNPRNCELHSNLHRVILEYAVKLAQQAWVSQNK